MQKVTFGGHIGSLMGGYWGPLAACWSLLGVFFVNVFPGTFLGAYLAPKLVHLGMDNV